MRFCFLLVVRPINLIIIDAFIDFMAVEEFDLENAPQNPRLLFTFRQFIQWQKEKLEKHWPEGIEFECRKCADCCTWNYFFFQSDSEDLIRMTHDVGGSNPHGWWVLTGDNLRLWLPRRAVETETKEVPVLSFDGRLPDKHLDFLRTTGRRHGYWVMNKADDYVIYSPTPCQHLQENGLCAIYEDRPQVCRDYSCKRFPKGGE